MNYSRGAPYSYNDWLRDIRVELNIPRGGSETYLREKAKYDKERIKKVNKMCPPGYRYRPKRKPGQRKCTKEKVKSVLSFLQMLAVQNRIPIFKVRKDKKGYTRTLLTIPQLKSRLTRNGISYKMNNTSKFGMEQQNPPWRDSQEPPFHGMSEADYNEVQAMIRSRPQRRLQPRPQLTPEQIARRAESWEARAEELEARGESSEGYSTNQNGRRVALPSWREILETRERARIREAVMNSSSPGAGAAFGVLEPRRNISSRNIRRDSEDVLGEMENIRRRRGRDLMRRQIAGDIIFPKRIWHEAAPPHATTIQRYARGMLGRNIKPNRFGVLPGREQGPDEPEDPRIAYEIEKKRKAAERNRKWRAAQSEANSEKLEAIREAQMDRAAADAIRYLGMTPKERILAKARERRELGKRAKEFLASQGAGSSSDPNSGLDFRVLEPDFGKTRYTYPRNSYGTQEVWQ